MAEGQNMELEYRTAVLAKFNLSTQYIACVRGATQNFREFDIPRKPLALRTCAARCPLLYLSSVSQQTCVFISACVSEFWLFSLHRFRVCLRISYVLARMDFTLRISKAISLQAVTLAASSRQHKICLGQS